MAHIIASDAHKPYRRKPVLREARDIAAKIVGYEQAEAMVSLHPMAVVNNQPIAMQPVYW
jgi:tyrosine-protein phosphatase YwqE